MHGNNSKNKKEYVHCQVFRSNFRLETYVPTEKDEQLHLTE